MSPYRARPFLKELLASPVVASGEIGEIPSRSLRDFLASSLDELPDVPDKLKQELKARITTDPISILLFLGGFVFALGMGFLQSYFQPFATLFSYKAARSAQQARFTPDQARQLYLRGIPTPERREEFLADLKDLGWSDERIEALKKLFYVMPTPSDIVLWLGREVFEPKMIEKYGLDSEWDMVERYGLDWFNKIGLDPDMAKNYWRAHWSHAALGQVYSMLHRGLISEDDMREYYRLVEIPEFWRDKLTELSWDLPNRI